jgi:hypothetical protein
MTVGFHNSMGVSILNYWKSEKPQMVKDLRRQGLLEKVLGEVTDRVQGVRYAAMEVGMNWDQIDELGRAEYMTPSVEEVPWSLGT